MNNQDRITDIQRSIELGNLREAERKRLLEKSMATLAADTAKIVADFAKLQNAATGRAIDSALSRSSVRTEVAVTRELERSRLSLHDHALNNPTLAKILRELQKAGTL